MNPPLISVRHKCNPPDGAKSPHLQRETNIIQNQRLPINLTITPISLTINPQF